MKLERKHAVVLLAIAVWNVVIWARFGKNMADTHEQRSAAFLVVHGLLVVANVAIAGVLGTWGWKAFRAGRPG